MILTLSNATLLKLNNIGELRRPSEAVGVIVHTNRVIELPNRSDRPHDRFLFGVEDLMMELDNNRVTMSEQDWEDMVIWHTHPGGLVGPSSLDLVNRVAPVQHLVITLTPEGPIPTLY